MKKYVILVIALLVTEATSIIAQDSVRIDMSKMKTYYFVMLTSGKNRNQDTATVQKMQKGHLVNITKLYHEGKLIVAGPFLDDAQWRGIFIFDVKSKEEVEKLLQTDPAIAAGRLDYEIHPWMTQKGTCFN